MALLAYFLLALLILVRAFMQWRSLRKECSKCGEWYSAGWLGDKKALCPNCCTLINFGTTENQALQSSWMNLDITSSEGPVLEYENSFFDLLPCVQLVYNKHRYLRLWHAGRPLFRLKSQFSLIIISFVSTGIVPLLIKNDYSLLDLFFCFAGMYAITNIILFMCLPHPNTQYMAQAFYSALVDKKYILGKIKLGLSSGGIIFNHENLSSELKWPDIHFARLSGAIIINSSIRLLIPSIAFPNNDALKRFEELLETKCKHLPGDDILSGL